MSQAHSPAVVATRLDQLLVTIEESAAELRKYLEKQIKEQPNGDPRALYPFFGDHQASNYASVLKIACERLNTLVTPPHLLVMEEAGSFYTTAACQTAVKHDVAAHIKELSPNGKGAPLSELAAITKLDEDLLGRILRFLSQKGIFQEIAPGRFENTTATLTLIDDPQFKAFLDLLMTENRLGAAELGTYMEKLYESKETGEKAPLNPFAIYSGLPLYEWLHLPENADRGRNFGEGMRGMAHSESTFSLPFDYGFKDLPQDKPLVDVGGGIGAIAEILLAEYPNLNMIVQDLEPVVEEAKKSPSENNKKWMAEGRLTFETQDFFTEQPAKLKGCVFFLSNVIHNYPDDKAIEILKILRRSDPTKILLVERVIGPFLPVEASSVEGEIEIYKNIRSSARGIAVQGIPIPPRSQSLPGMYDLVMATLVGAKERSLTEWQKLFKDAGYKLTGVSPLRASGGQSVVSLVRGFCIPNMILYKLPLIATLVYAINYSGRPPVSKAIYKNQPPTPLVERLFSNVGPTLTLCFWIEGVLEFTCLLLCGLFAMSEEKPFHTTCKPLTGSVVPVHYMVGWSLIVAGTFLRRACYKELARLFTFVIGIQKGHQLITTGPYSIVRHPGYAAFVLINAGLILVHVNHQPIPSSFSPVIEAIVRIYNAAYILVSTAATVFLLKRADLEEKLLQAEFGDAWVKWARTVRWKFVPGLW
ncbi:hypothetical protein CVT24_006330 [Panaeolus cyanescens]|uniref:Protein-S-isoprenylcysteine O-methyltransferase n=1 Tax=Panaeolus cyanescens TaxID=181874 RepID=A0A409YEA3_9AGAR|nr:hypothetical protein CVT24_006330 [Panaeolus cyanescens]